MNPLVQFSAEQMARATEIATAIARRTASRASRWVYEGEGDEEAWIRHRVVALLGEIAAARLMRASTFPERQGDAHDFLAHGWWVDVKSTKYFGSVKLMVREGHRRKIEANDVLALVSVSIERAQAVFHGWEFSRQFFEIAPLVRAQHTEPAWTLHATQLRPLSEWDEESIAAGQSRAETTVAERRDMRFFGIEPLPNDWQSSEDAEDDFFAGLPRKYEHERR